MKLYTKYKKSKMKKTL